AGVGSGGERVFPVEEGFAGVIVSVPASVESMFFATNVIDLADDLPVRIVGQLSIFVRAARIGGNRNIAQQLDGRRIPTRLRDHIAREGGLVVVRILQRDSVLLATAGRDRGIVDGKVSGDGRGCGHHRTGPYWVAALHGL